VKRLQEHETKTIPVIEKYKQFHEVVTVDGRGKFDEVFQKLSAELESGIRSVR
jgi:adenylate kinase